MTDGWRVDPNDATWKAKIGYSAKIGNSVKIGNLAEIGNSVKIGNLAEIGAGFPCVSLIGKWLLHPYAPGKVCLGCYIGDYETLRNRTKADWDKHGYTEAHVRLILATLDYFQAIERDVFDFDYKPEIPQDVAR